MPTIFISRDLDPDSLLLEWANQNKFPLIAKSLLTFSPVRFSPPLRADVWFFYSSRAVEFGIDGLEHVQKLPALAAFGKGTAATLEKLGFPVDFVGHGDPIEVANQFAETMRAGSVFFPRARQSRRSVQRMLPSDFTVLDAICYDNVAVADVDFIEADIYVFTSPLNVSAYFRHHEVSKASRVIAIGPSTGAALIEAGVPHQVASEPTEAAIINLIAG